MSGTRSRRWLAPTASVLLFAVALLVLRRELNAFTYWDVVHAIRAVPLLRIAAAFGLTIVSYAVLTGYDTLALAYVPVRIAWARLAFISAISYAVSHVLGFPALTGGAVRVRYWTSWGISATQIAQALTFVAWSFVLGMLLMAGVAFAMAPHETTTLLRLPPLMLRSIGVLLLGIVAAYLAASVALSSNQQAREVNAAAHPARIGKWQLRYPAPRLAVFQVLLVACDWTVAAAVLWVLLPTGTSHSGVMPFLPFLAAFLVAQFAGVLSHVPGGIGVFESLMVTLLAPYVGAAPVLGALVAYRFVYYLVPFVLALIALGIDETHAVRRRLAAVTAKGARASAHAARAVGPRVVPFALSAATFVAGALLLLTGATPELRPRVIALDQALPLGIIELSHFAASIAGAALIVLAWALRRRLDAAWAIAVVTLVIGIFGALLRGLDYEEASLLLLVLILLVTNRRAFYRKAALTSEPFTRGWIIAVAMVLTVTAWLGLFSYKHVQYQHELWWQFTTHGDAPRFLRAMIGTLGGILVFGLQRLLRHARPLPTPPSAHDMARAAEIVRNAPAPEAHLALLGDKSLLFSDSGRSFIMYAVEGRSWIALHDPVGPVDEHEDLAWKFRQLVDEHGGWAVYYQVSVEHLPLYIDLGLSLFKLGEEARVSLNRFSLEGGSRKGMRRVVHSVTKAGGRLEIIPAEGVQHILPELRRVSDDWISQKEAREKGFSLGYFDEAYLCACPVALVYVTTPTGDRLVAFANMWCGADKEKLSVDLMRYSSDAPEGVMEFLFIELMLWAKNAGYREFNLGMAPLSGLERRPVATLWSRAGSLVYRHGENFYNFQGLRRYKEKFDPDWSPRYLAAPRGLPLPRILANITTLIARGSTA